MCVSSNHCQALLARSLLFLSCPALKHQFFHESSHLLVLVICSCSHRLQLRLQMPDPRVRFVELVILRALFSTGIYQCGGQLAIRGLVSGEKGFGGR
jgi:hypothetical protein